MDIYLCRKIVDFDGYFVTNKGEIFSNRRGSFKKLKGCSRYLEYQSISIYKNNKRYNMFVHRAVLMSFNPINTNLEVNHIDGNKTNNNLNNLEWCTKKENVAHSIKTGLRNINGEKQHCSKLKNDDIPMIRELINLGYKNNVIAFRYNVSPSAISCIKNKKTWNSI